MSTFVPSTIVCRCGERYTVEVANGLHISLRPDIRQQIFDGTFHRFFCPACGMTTMVDTLMSTAARAGGMAMPAQANAPAASGMATML